MAEATQELERLIAALSEEQVRQVVDFAKFLHSDERREWREFGRQRFARAYGNAEPEYTHRHSQRIEAVTVGIVVLIALPRTGGGPPSRRPT